MLTLPSPEGVSFGGPLRPIPGGGSNVDWAEWLGVALAGWVVVSVSLALAFARIRAATNRRERILFFER